MTTCSQRQVTVLARKPLNKDFICRDGGPETDVFLGVRDAKANLSWAIGEVKQGRQIVITEYGVPVARLVPVRTSTLDETLAEMRSRGVLEPAGGPLGKPLPLFDVPEGFVEKSLEEGREWPQK